MYIFFFKWHCPTWNGVQHGSGLPYVKARTLQKLISFIQKETKYQD